MDFNFESAARVAPENTLSVDFINALVNQYKDNQHRYDTDGIGMEDANCVWYDLETLKKFISAVENVASEVNPGVKTEDLGIRFYYGAYPEDTEEPNIPDDYKKRHTLVMIPTMKSPDSAGRIVDNDFAPFELDGTMVSVAQNHGRVSPPEACDGMLY